MTAMFKVIHHRAALLLLAGSMSALLAQGVEDLRMTVGKSIVIDYPSDVGRISTSNPDVVDAVAVTTREILLHGKAQGSVTLVVWSKTGQRTFYNVSVEQNLDSLRRILKETFPSEDIHVQSSKDSLSLTGLVSSPVVAERSSALAGAFAKTVVNNLKIHAAPIDKQILLRVKFAELDRSVARSFAINLFSTGATNTIGSLTTGQFAGPSINTIKSAIPGQNQGFTSTFSLSDALNILAFRPDLNLGAVLKDLQDQRILQILAEPNLVTTNGKEASFHVGGEFPIPVLQGGANAGAVTIQFREFGIRLLFTPVLTENDTIKMYVKPEVSTIDLSNAVTVSGFVIPALSTRKMETNIELGQGQSFVIAGLIDDRVQDAASKLPGLANIPILGALFKSRNDQKARTELIVMVTPEIALPMQKGDPKPMPVWPKEFLPTLTPKPASNPGEDAVKTSEKHGTRNPIKAVQNKLGGGSKS